MKDTYGREITYLRLSITELCNLRCLYCMPAEGVPERAPEEMLTEEEMIRAVETAASLGITKIRITGGEPLMNPNVIRICRRIAATEGIGQVVLTTNGTRLPKLASLLREVGVQRVNLSLDTLNPERYARMTRGGRLEEALAGLRAALEAGFDRVKVNAVLIGGFNTDEIPELAELTRKHPVDVRFIELMPMPGNAEFGPEAYIPGGRVLEALPEAEPVGTDGVARQYRLPDAQGTIGLISPLSSHFCAACNRLRLTADGHLKPCLHSRDEISIKGLNREEMREAFLRSIQMKPKQHEALSATEISRAARPMNRIGG